jgi:hypothetical protein
MRAYFMSSPERIGYRQRMLSIWKDQNPNKEMTEQRLADQRRQIEKGKMLSLEELEEVKRSIVQHEGAYLEENHLAEVSQVSTDQMLPESENNAMQTEMGEFGKRITENILPRSERSRLPH